MAGTQNSISSLIAQFLRLQKNALEIINGLNEVATSTNETVSIQILDENGNPTNANIPSYGFVRNEIQRLDSNVQALAGLGANSSTVRNPDGTYSQIFKAQALRDPAPLRNLQVPSTFASKDNWFFESFLSPLLYVSVDVTGQIPDASDRILVKRVIANTTTESQKDFFDLNLKGKNNLSYDSFISQLTAAGIDYFTDEDIIQIPLRKLRYTGSFGVVSYYDDVVSTTDLNGQTVQSTRRNYKLTKITYTDTTTGVVDGKSLNVGDRISTSDGTIYLVTSVNIDESSVQLKRLSGYQPVQIGANTISIYSTDFGPRYVDVNVGYDERQGVFFKTIDDNFNVISSTWSTGIVFWSNELQTLNSSGQLQTLENFYLNQVADIGKVFLDMAKEKKIPAIQSVKPSAPVLDQTNFKVVQINKQLTDSIPSKTATQKISAKSTLKSEISSLDASINQAKLQLNAAKSISQTNTANQESVQTIQANLDSLVDQKSKKVQLYSSVVEDIKATLKDVSQIASTPKYRVRGFWDIPAPIVVPQTGSQNVIQFKVRYRYLSDSGSVQPNEQIQYKDSSGNTKTGTFSNWVEFLTPIRKKSYDASKGIYVWDTENTADGDVANINQLDIPISKGEQVEIQIASISEAGWPDNPATSDFSTSVTIGFPSDLAVDGLSDILDKNSEDAAVVKVQTDLQAQGLPQHLSEQFTENNVTYFHQANNIASGYFNSAGGVISLFDKINELQLQIKNIQNLITLGVGVMEVYLLDGISSLRVQAGQLIQLDAGFYNDIYTSADYGKIATKTYLIQISNNSATPVELSSIVPGGSNTQAPTTSYAEIEGYGTNLRYGGVPISYTTYPKSEVTSNTAIYQEAPFASAQTYGQFVYSRFKNLGFDRNLYLSDSQIPSFNDSYDYQGTVPSTQFFGVDGGVMPLNGSCLIPYDPEATPPSVSGATAASIWNGSYSGSTPVGGGVISEFCIHRSHPALNTGNTPEFIELVKPVYDNTVTGSIVYPYFRHALGFYADAILPEFYMQTQYRVPTVAPSATTQSADRLDSQYPDRMSFYADDEYLVGKYSCGSYLFLGVPETNFLNVDGFSAQSSRLVYEGPANSVNVPLIFQFRAADKLGYIGGWRKLGNLSNVTYAKTIGIDLKQKNRTIFSFDVAVTGKFRNSTLVAPNFGGQVTPPAGSSVNIINLATTGIQNAAQDVGNFIGGLFS